MTFSKLCMQSPYACARGHFVQRERLLKRIATATLLGDERGTEFEEWER